MHWCVKIAHAHVSASIVSVSRHTGSSVQICIQPAVLPTHALHLALNRSPCRKSLRLSCKSCLGKCCWLETTVTTAHGSDWLVRVKHHHLKRKQEAHEGVCVRGSVYENRPLSCKAETLSSCMLPWLMPTIACSNTVQRTWGHYKSQASNLDVGS